MALYEETKKIQQELNDKFGSDDPIKTLKIALAHIEEIKDYYIRLDKMESEAKKEQAPQNEDDPYDMNKPVNKNVLEQGMLSEKAKSKKQQKLIGSNFN